MTGVGWQKLCGLAMVALAVWVASTLPFAKEGVLAVTALLVAVVLWRPPWVLAAVAVGISAVDLTPWTGRFIFNEFDAWMLAAIGAALCSNHFTGRGTISQSSVLVLAAIVCSYALSTIIGLLPSNSGNTVGGNVYVQPLNTLRIAKAFCYALPIWFLLLRSKVGSEKTFHNFSMGTAIGLALTVMVVLLQRHRFCGLLDFTADFRAVGPFASMHVGGAFLDAYLVMSLPLLAVCYRRCGTVGKFSVICTALGTILATFATLSRAPIVAVVVQGVLLVVLLQKFGNGSARAWHWQVVAVVVLCVIAVSAALFQPLGERFSSVVPDARTRVEHWSQSLAVDEEGLVARLVGIGCGKYPLALREKYTASTSGGYEFNGEGQQKFLRLTGTERIYFSQFVDIQPETTYRFAIRGRRVSEAGALTASLEEKCALHSGESIKNVNLFASNARSKWTELEWEFDSRNVGKQHDRGLLPSARMPTALSFWVSPGASIDISDVQLFAEGGQPLIANSDFGASHDNWWWTSDAHLSWHTKNVFIHLLVEQGWLGLLAFVALLATAFHACFRAGRQNLGTVTLACSLTGFLVIGQIDSLVDSPRILLYILVLVGLALCGSWRESDLIAPLHANAVPTRHDSPDES